MKYLKLAAVAAAAVAFPTTADAVVTVTQFGSTSLGSFSYTVVGRVITLNETWTNSNNVFLQFNGLDGSPYTIVKNITNNSGAAWTSIANELLDPGVDPLDPTPQPAFVPFGYSTSNDSDGLSFNQGGGDPRTSTLFPNVAADELSDARDFLDFFGATANSGSSFSLTYGLIDTGPNQPFLLSQRVNVRSTPAVPEPATWAMMLLGFGSLGIVLRGRRPTATRVRFV